MLLLALDVLPPPEPLLSRDTWGLIFVGTLVLVLWLAFRRMFPEDKPEAKPEDKKPK
jgi:hypothetical protein